MARVRPGRDATTARVCAVVPTFNRMPLLERCLAALLGQTRPLDEVVVINNASTEPIERRLRERFPGVSYMSACPRTRAAPAATRRVWRTRTGTATTRSG
jgi:cellulose synthase/poly-beta-1,6-N-acetylglucosamine synthase-like glycosyltransferase